MTMKLRMPELQSSFAMRRLARKFFLCFAVLISAIGFTSTALAQRATGTLTFVTSSDGQTRQMCAMHPGATSPSCMTIPFTGEIEISIDGFTTDIVYPAWYDTALSENVAAAFDPLNSPVTTTTNNGTNVVTFTSKAYGTAGNYPYTISLVTTGNDLTCNAELSTTLAGGVGSSLPVPTVTASIDNSSIAYGGFATITAHVSCGASCNGGGMEFLLDGQSYTSNPYQPDTVDSTGTGAMALFTWLYVHPGSHSLQANYLGSTAYDPASSPVFYFTVTKATPQITWTPAQTIVAGTPLSSAQLNASDTAENGGSFAYTPGIGTTFSPGTYTLSAAFTPFDPTDYVPTTATSTLTVTPKITPVITWASSQSMPAGTPLSAAQLNATASVAGTFVYSPNFGTTFAAGTYTLSAAFTPTDTTDYNAVTVTSALTVTSSGSLTYGTGTLSITEDAGRRICASYPGASAPACLDILQATGMDIAINGFTAVVDPEQWNDHDLAAQIALAFAPSSAPITATANGTIVTLISKTPGTSGNFPYTITLVTQGNEMTCQPGLTSALAGGAGATPPPLITAITPASSTVGGHIVVSGSSFGPNGVIMFNGVSITPIAWSDSSISVLVPQGVGPENVVVQSSGGVQSNLFPFIALPPTITLTAQSPAPYYFGHPVELIAQTSSGTTGTVSFTMDGLALPNPSALSSSDRAIYVATGLTVGPHAFVANYSGDASNPSSSSLPLVINVEPSPTTTTVTLSPITSWLGYPVSVNVTVAAAGGTVPTSGGGVSCTAVPPTGSPITPPAVPLSGSTTFAQVLLTGLPVTATGTSYSVTCSFTASDSRYINSNNAAAPALGTVINRPSPVNSPSGSMLIPRMYHEANLLPDGTVLVTGGTNGNQVLASAEIYSAGSFVPGAQMSTPREFHRATLLSNSNGQVLITGGTDGSSALATAELFTPGATPGTPGTFALASLFDQATGTYTGGPSQMNVPRQYHTATLLPGGQVLIAGGTSSNNVVTAAAELYNPSTGAFTMIAPMTTPRSQHTATLLSDGTVLLAGGVDDNGNKLGTSEIFNPGTNQFTALVGSPMVSERVGAEAELRGDGTVLFIGGASSGSSGAITYGTYDAEVYHAAQFVSHIQTLPPAFNAGTAMTLDRVHHTMTTLYDGSVLTAGGTQVGSSGVVGTEELYGANAVAGQLIVPRAGHTATLLPNNVGVLFVGGMTTNGTITGTSEIYHLSNVTSGLHPKYVVLDVLYAPPGSGSSLTYTNQTAVGNTSSTTNSFTEAATLSLSSAKAQLIGKVAKPEITKDNGTTKAGSPGTTYQVGGLTGTIEGDFTYKSSGTASFAMTTTTTDALVVPGPKSSAAGVDHESDIVQVWINPELDYTVGSNAYSLVWNGYATNPDDTNVAPGEMDIIPLTIGQLDGTSPIPTALQQILDRNWDPVSAGGAGGITQADLGIIKQRDPFADNLSFDPNLPVFDSATNSCAGRYTFDPVHGQTFPYTPLSTQNQPLTQNYTISSAKSLNWDEATSDTYSVGVSANFKIGTSLDSLKATDTVTFVNSWDPAKANSQTTSQALSIVNPKASDGYNGPGHIQIWQDNLYGTYMFYPKPEDTVVNLISSQPSAIVGGTTTFTATIVPDKNVAGNAVPTGSVTFILGCKYLGSANVGPNGTATLQFTWTTATYQATAVRAVYSGDGNYYRNISNSVSMTVLDEADLPLMPQITSLSQYYGPVGTVLTITGVRLEPYAPIGLGTVSFNGIDAPIISQAWDSSSVTVIVPWGATTGPVTFTSVFGESSNSLTFFVVGAQEPPFNMKLSLSPQTTWSGYHPVATALIQFNPNVTPNYGGISPNDTVSCISNPSTGVPNLPATVNPVTGVAMVTIMDAPVLPPGDPTLYQSQTYAVQCGFTTHNVPSYMVPYNVAGATVIGTVIQAPPARVGGLSNLNNERQNQQATLLNNGSLLITGGDTGKYAGASKDNPYITFVQASEIYAGTVFSLDAAMLVPRSLHQATLLSNSSGQVLITGGTNGAALASAELYTPGTAPGAPGTFAPTTLYDPAAQGFTTTITSMNTPRYWHTATLLLSGKVLIVGGTGSIGSYNPGQNSYTATIGANGTPQSSLATAELYDPSTGKFTYTSGPMTAARTRHTATLLMDGTVLIAGGMDVNGHAIATAEIYNPATDTFQAITAPMRGGRIKAQATRLGNGTVLITGGSIGIESDGGCPGFRSTRCARIDAEIYDPVAKTFTATPNMVIARYSHTATVLYDGTVLLDGGITNQYSWSGNSNYDTASTQEIYDPKTGQFTATIQSLNPRYNHTATLLPAGGVMMVGGISGDTLGALPLGPPYDSYRSAEIYAPPVQSGPVYPKFMVLNLMYAPPGAGSSVSYTNNTQVGTTTTQAQQRSNAFSISVGGSTGIHSVPSTFAINLGYTFAQTSTTAYGLNTTTTDATVVPGPTSSSFGVDHEADVLWVWLNPESDYTLTNPTSLVWTGYATNQNDPNVSSGDMDVVPLTVGQLDGTTPIAPDLRALLDRNWDPTTSGGAGGLTADDFKTVLQRDPFAVNLTAVTTPGTGVPAALPTNAPPAAAVPNYSAANYPTVDPNVPVHDANNQDPNQCGKRFQFDTNSGQTFQYAALGSTNQPLSQNYSLQTTATTTQALTITDTYFVDVSVGACFGFSGSVCGITTDGNSGNTITVNLDDKYTWGEATGSSFNDQTMGTQALTIKNPLPGDNYGGPVQMQVWKDNLFNTYMFYPKATDTTVSLSTSQAITQIGYSVKFTAVITPDTSLPGGSHVPTGTVTFYDGCNMIGGAPQPLVNGVAAVSTSWSSIGTHEILAVYSGDANFFNNDAPALVETVHDSLDNLPHIDSLTPDSQYAQNVVTITGENFGSYGAVTFNGIPGSIVSWSGGTIIVTVPAGATSGTVVVTANNFASNGVPFTLLTPPATTITTLTLTPSVSWSGTPVSAHITITAVPQASITGSVTCWVSSSAGTVSSSAVALNPATFSANIPLIGLPTVPPGAANTAAYTAVCIFTSSNSGYTGSQSNVAAGKVTNSPSAEQTPTLGLNIPRENQQANLLQDGTILITGGDNVGGAISTSEIFTAKLDSSSPTGNFFTLAAPMSVPRTGHQATLLSNSSGQVLITGGTDNNGTVYSSAELFTPGPTPGNPGSFNTTTLYDATAQAFTSTSTSMNVARTFHTATQLVSGKVLITGGEDANGNPVSSAELFDPTAGTFTYTTGSLVQPRYGHNATLLTDGTVLITGGRDASGNPTLIAEIYNPVTNVFTVTQNATKTPTQMVIARLGARAVVLGGGTVLISGGQDSFGNALNSAEIYTPATGTFTLTQDANGTSNMALARYSHTATLLPDGTVLITGGQGIGGTAISGQEIYNPVTGDFSTVAASMITPRSNHTATFIPNGSVLLAGGESSSGSFLTAAELFSSTMVSTAIFPKFMVLDVLYAPPGAGSNMTYTNTATVGTSTSTDSTFEHMHSDTVGVGVIIPEDNMAFSLSVTWGKTTTQDSTSSFVFNTTTTNSLVVPGPVAAGTAGTTKQSTGVDHEADVLRVWLNPATLYTLPPASTASVIWNGFATNPNDPNVSPGAMDIVSLTVSQLDGTSPIPEELQAVLDRNWDPRASGGVGGLQPADLQTILQRDPFATNTSLAGPAAVSDPDTYFDPNIPVYDPIAMQCSTRYSFDPVLGQTFPFGLLGSTNQPFTQSYSLQSSSSNVIGNTTIDQYSVEKTNQVGFNIPIYYVILTLNFANDDKITWTNKWSNTKTNTTGTTQALSIKNPVLTDSYTGPTQIQVWQDDIYGTFMFYPKPADTFVALASSQSTDDGSDTVVFRATVLADPRVAAQANPPLAPSGTVKFYDGCYLIGTAQVNTATGVAFIKIPSLAAGTHSILAAYSGDLHFQHNVSEPLTESVISGAASGPFIGWLSKTSGFVNDPVTISGANFGTSGTVTFNGVPAVVTGWTPTRISTTVPIAATTGAVVVTTSNVKSDGRSFTVYPQSGHTTTSVALSPATSLSGYPVVANVTVTGAVNTVPVGTVSCTVASPTSTGMPTTPVTLDATGAAKVYITDLPIVPANGTPVPFTVTCGYTAQLGSVNNSQSGPIPGVINADPVATQSVTGSLNIPRENQQATLMQDGTVLVTGGDNTSGALSSSEIYSNGVFSLGTSMTTPRTGHQQTLLNNATGQVLITGGSAATGSALATAELFTPGAQPGVPGSFQQTTQFNTQAQVFTNTVTSMTTARYRHTATLLITGKVLITGGSNAAGTPLATAELYDPATGLFTATSTLMHSARVGHAATLLLDGTVLITGGGGASAEIYDPLTDLFTVTHDVNGAPTSLNVARLNHQATRLGSGLVLITGGGQGPFGSGANTAELYDPATGTFRYTQTAGNVQANMVAARSNHSATLLYDGTVLITGGQSATGSTLSTMESYNPATGVFTSIGTGLQVPRHNQSATLLPTMGVLIAGGTNTIGFSNTMQASAELYSPFTLVAGIHPKFMVLNIQYAPPGLGSTMSYTNAAMQGTSTATENTFQHQQSESRSVGVNFGVFKASHTVTQTWTSTQDNKATYSLTNTTTKADVVPGPSSSALGVDHESDLIWIWLNPVANYTITSPSTFVWNGFGVDADDPNSEGSNAMDIIPLSVSQLDGTSPITQAEWNVLDRNWDPISIGGAGGITPDDFKILLQQDPFATNLSGVGRSTAPTVAPTGDQYALFDPHVPTLDTVTGQCGNRYDFAPGFNTTFPFTQLGSNNQALTQNYSLATNNAQTNSTTATNTYKVAVSANFAASKSIGFTFTGGEGPSGTDGDDLNFLDRIGVTGGKIGPDGGDQQAPQNALTFAFKATGFVQWTNAWTVTKNTSTLVTQALAIKNPLAADGYTGPEQMQVWKDNLYGTFMFYPKPSDTSWTLTSSQSTVSSGSQVTFTATVTADQHVPAIPTGTVTFYDGCTVLDVIPVNVATGTATSTRPLTGTGPHTIQAIFSGDSNFYHNNAPSLTVTVQ